MRVLLAGADAVPVEHGAADPVHLPLMLRDEHGYSPAQAGAVLAVSSVAWALGSWLQGRLGDGVDRYRVMLLGVLTFAAMRMNFPLQDALLASEELTAGDHRLPWDGRVPVCEAFPDGVVTVEHSPYKLKLTRDGSRLFVALSGLPKCPPSVPDEECAKLERDLKADGIAVINADDFYGQSAYKNAADFIRAHRDDNTYALVGYTLRDTLSTHGSVSRGVCQVEGDTLLLVGTIAVHLLRIGYKIRG